MLAALTVYVVAGSEPDWQSLSKCCEDAGAAIVRVARGLLARELPPVIASGAVVVVVSSEADATLALGIGADEVMRVGELGPDVIQRTFERARLRASARAMRDRRALGTSESESGMSLLGSALGDQLVEPLCVATAECRQVTDAVRVLLDLSDDLVGWAALSAPTEEMRRLAARRLAAPSTAQVRQALQRMQSALSDARFMADKLRELVAGAAGDGCLRADRLAAEFANLVAPHLASVATLEVHPANDCALPVTTSFFLSVAALLVSNALGALRDAERTPGRIVLHASEVEGVPVLTVEDDAGEIIPDIGSAAGASSSRRSRSDVGLSALRERLRARGGDLIVQSDSSGTQVRVIFPVLETELAAGPEGEMLPQSALDPGSRGLN